MLYSNEKIELKEIDMGTYKLKKASSFDDVIFQIKDSDLRSGFSKIFSIGKTKSGMDKIYFNKDDKDLYILLSKNYINVLVDDIDNIDCSKYENTEIISHPSFIIKMKENKDCIFEIKDDNNKKYIIVHNNFVYEVSEDKLVSKIKEIKMDIPKSYIKENKLVPGLFLPLEVVGNNKDKHKIVDEMFRLTQYNTYKVSSKRHESYDTYIKDFYELNKNNLDLFLNERKTWFINDRLINFISKDDYKNIYNLLNENAENLKINILLKIDDIEFIKNLPNSTDVQKTIIFKNYSELLDRIDWTNEDIVDFAMENNLNIIPKEKIEELSDEYIESKLYYSLGDMIGINLLPGIKNETKYDYEILKKFNQEENEKIKDYIIGYMYRNNISKIKKEDLEYLNTTRLYNYYYRKENIKRNWKIDDVKELLLKDISLTNKEIEYIESLEKNILVNSLKDYCYLLKNSYENFYLLDEKYSDEDFIQICSSFINDMTREEQVDFYNTIINTHYKSDTIKEICKEIFENFNDLETTLSDKMLKASPSLLETYNNFSDEAIIYMLERLSKIRNSEIENYDIEKIIENCKDKSYEVQKALVKFCPMAIKYLDQTEELKNIAIENIKYFGENNYYGTWYGDEVWSHNTFTDIMKQFSPLPYFKVLSEEQIKNIIDNKIINYTFDLLDNKFKTKEMINYYIERHPDEFDNFENQDVDMYCAKLRGDFKFYEKMDFHKFSAEEKSKMIDVILEKESEYNEDRKTKSTIFRPSEIEIFNNTQLAKLISYCPKTIKEIPLNEEIINGIIKEKGMKFFVEEIMDNYKDVDDLLKIKNLSHKIQEEIILNLDSYNIRDWTKTDYLEIVPWDLTKKYIEKTKDISLINEYCSIAYDKEVDSEDDVYKKLAYMYDKLKNGDCNGKIKITEFIKLPKFFQKEILKNNIDIDFYAYSLKNKIIDYSIQKTLFTKNKEEYLNFIDKIYPMPIDYAKENLEESDFEEYKNKIESLLSKFTPYEVSVLFDIKDFSIFSEDAKEKFSKIDYENLTDDEIIFNKEKRESKFLSFACPRFEFWHRTGGATNLGYAYVIRPDGTERLNDDVKLRNPNHRFHSNYMHSADGTQIWNVIYPEELVLGYTKSCTAAPFIPYTIQVPKNITKEQLAEIERIESSIMQSFDLNNICDDIENYLKIDKSFKIEQEIIKYSKTFEKDKESR